MKNKIFPYNVGCTNFIFDAETKEKLSPEFENLSDFFDWCKLNEWNTQGIYESKKSGFVFLVKKI